MLPCVFLPFELWFFSVFSLSFSSQRHDVIYIIVMLLFGFACNCSSLYCGGNMTTTSGVITSPMYSNTSYVNCKWVIVAKKWDKISLKFISFHLGKETSPSSSSCDTQLEIFDGVDSTEKYCRGWDSNPKDTITSETNSLTLILRAKNNNGDIMLTFQASFETHCTGLFTADKDEIISPNYPGFYPVPQYCSWKIQVPRDKVIRLHFLEFNLESTSQCNMDYVRVIDGLNSSSSWLIGHFCADRTPPKQVRSTSNTMMLDFKAFKPTKTGRFHFYYAAEPHCGGYLRGSSGSFTSPGYTDPLYRTSSTDCVWTIEVPKEMVISVVFVTFDVKSSERCANDYVAIMDGSGTMATSMGRYCGSQVTNPPTVRSTKNTITIKLHRSSSDPGRGFYATYTAADPKNPYDKCTEAAGGLLFTCNNDNRIQCHWKCDGTDDCGDSSDEQHCNINPEITVPAKKAQMTSYVVILVSITGSAVLIALFIFIIDRLRRKRRSQASSRRRRRRRARLRALDADFRDLASPPPTYDFAVTPSSCCDATSFPPTYAESMATTSMNEGAAMEQINNQEENAQSQTNIESHVIQEHSHEIEGHTEVDCISLGESPPTNDTSPLIV